MMEIWQKSIHVSDLNLINVAEREGASDKCLSKLRDAVRISSMPYDVSNWDASWIRGNERFTHSYIGNMYENVVDLHFNLCDRDMDINYDCERYSQQVTGNTDRVYNGKTTQIKYRPLVDGSLYIYRSDFGKAITSCSKLRDDEIAHVDQIIYVTYINDKLVMIRNTYNSWREIYLFRPERQHKNGSWYVSVNGPSVEFLSNLGCSVTFIHDDIMQAVKHTRYISIPVQSPIDGSYIKQYQ